ncbi:MAG: dihydrofolate reductase family protein [Anaerolineae bacterium]|nr:dihydrofolate reductase family protein [Anaerolineae bacterium]
MGKVVVDITMSLDGFIAGTNISTALPMGDGGLRLHDWIFGGKTEADAKMLDESMKSAGAVIIGARIYRTAIDDAWGGVNPFAAPTLVLANHIPDQVVEGFTFINDGILSALERAKAIAGDKNVWVMGGANVIQQYLKAGLVDELHIHIAPVLFGEGTRLFEHIGAEPVELKLLENIQTPGATHLRFRVVK